MKTESLFYLIKEQFLYFNKNIFSFSFKITGIPVVKGHETLVIASYGMSVTLHVSIESSPQHFHIYWTKFVDREINIIHNSTIGTTGGSLFKPSLTIHFPTVSDAGIYQCYATNVLGIGYSENISLIVEGGTLNINSNLIFKNVNNVLVYFLAI